MRIFAIFSGNIRSNFSISNFERGFGKLLVGEFFVVPEGIYPIRSFFDSYSRSIFQLSDKRIRNFTVSNDILFVNYSFKIILMAMTLLSFEYIKLQIYCFHRGKYKTKIPSKLSNTFGKNGYEILNEGETIEFLKISFIKYAIKF